MMLVWENAGLDLSRLFLHLTLLSSIPALSPFFFFFWVPILHCQISRTPGPVVHCFPPPPLPFFPPSSPSPLRWHEEERGTLSKAKDAHPFWPPWLPGNDPADTFFSL